MSYNTIIVGAGPAGMACAHELNGQDVLVIDRGASIERREEVIDTPEAYDGVEVEGVGGSGGWSDGKLCLGPVGIRDEYIGPAYEAEAEAINQIFANTLGSRYVSPSDVVGYSQVEEGVTQEVSRVANLGTTAVRHAFQRLHRSLGEAGTRFMLEEQVVTIDDRENGGFTVRTATGSAFDTDTVVVATGKGDVGLTPRLIAQYELATTPAEPTVGFRLVVPRDELEAMHTVGSNPKLKIHLDNGDTVKTHCFTYAGEAMSYSCGGRMLVGGRADSEQPTDYATVAILYKLIQPTPDERKLILAGILNGMQKAHPGRIICQDVASFMDPSREPEPPSVPTCKKSELGSLLPYFPPDMINAYRRFITHLAATYHMRLDRAALLGPAAEWLNDAVVTSFNMESGKQGLYFIGDGSGITQGIVASAVAGRRAALDIKKRRSTP